eukprot:535993-Rhodomonas_salina.1
MQSPSPSLPSFLPPSTLQPALLCAGWDGGCGARVRCGAAEKGAGAFAKGSRASKRAEAVEPSTGCDLLLLGSLRRSSCWTLSSVVEAVRAGTVLAGGAKKALADPPRQAVLELVLGLVPLVDEHDAPEVVDVPDAPPHGLTPHPPRFSTREAVEITATKTPPLRIDRARIPSLRAYCLTWFKARNACRVYHSSPLSSPREARALL